MTKSAFRAVRSMVLPLAAFAILMGCHLGGSSNPLVGTWQGTVASSAWSETVTYQFKSDMTLAMLAVWYSVPPGDESTGTGLGSYTVDDSAKTVTVNVTIVYTQVAGTSGPSGPFVANATDAYSVSGSTLIITDPTWGAITLTKQ